MIKNIFIILLIIFSSQSFAHYVWIETLPEVKVGEKQSIKIFYGEYENNLKEEAGKRLEEINGLIAWIINPSGEKIIVELTKKENHFLTDFTPIIGGRYEIFVLNNQREVVDWSAHDIGVIKPVYYAHQTFFVSDLKVKQELQYDSANFILDLEIFSLTKNLIHENYFQKGNTILFNVYLRSEELTKAKLMVYAPNGWMKELERGANGLFTFTPLEKGQYLIECIYKERTPGQFNGKAYEAIRHRSILTIYVK
jgi:uncharacterized GH25 family protein